MKMEIISLPYELIERIASHMTAREWARSGGLATRAWSHICHKSVEIQIPWQVLSQGAALRNSFDNGRDPYDNGLSWLTFHMHEAEQLDAVIFLDTDFDVDRFVRYGMLLCRNGCLPRLRCVRTAMLTA